MTTIYIEAQHSCETGHLVQSALEGEIGRLELALTSARWRLLPF